MESEWGGKEIKNGDMTAPRHGGDEDFLLDKRERRARGSNIWESPELSHMRGTTESKE